MLRRRYHVLVTRTRGPITQRLLSARLRELAVMKPRWGSPRLRWRLRREGWGVNHKRIERLVLT